MTHLFNLISAIYFNWSLTLTQLHLVFGVNWCFGCLPNLPSAVLLTFHHGLKWKSLRRAWLIHYLIFPSERSMVGSWSDHPTQLTLIFMFLYLYLSQNKHEKSIAWHILICAGPRQECFFDINIAPSHTSFVEVRLHLANLSIFEVANTGRRYFGKSTGDTS